LLKKLIVVLLVIQTGFCAEQIATVGSGTTTWSYPLHTFNTDCRTQIIYYGSEINTSGFIKAIAFNVSSSQTAAISDVKIRFRRSTLTSYSATAFDCNGWTVVYDGSWPVGTGWVKVDLDYPYLYDCNENLLVDVSIDHSSASSLNTSCYTTTGSTSRVLYAAIDGGTYDPQVWSLGGYGPSGTASVKVPNIKFYIDSQTHWQSLGVMSFNVRYANNVEDDPCDNYTDVPTGCTPRRDRVLEMVRNANQTFGSKGPDIIGMQEPYDRRNQIFDVVNGLDGKWAWTGINAVGVMSVDTGYGYTPIFYKKDRFNGKDQGTFWLSETPDEPSMHSLSSYYRVGTWIILHDKYTNRDYFIINTHMDGTIDEQSTVIMNKLETLAGDLPIILMGDLNAIEDSNVCNILTGSMGSYEVELHECFRDIYPVAQPCERSTSSFTGNITGNRRIDHIYSTDDLICRGFTIERGKVLGRYPSDHYPITANFYVPTNMLSDLDGDSDVDISDVSAFCDDWLLEGHTLTNSTVGNGLLGRWSFDSAMSGSHYDANGINNAAADFNGFADGAYSSSSLGTSLSNFTITFWMKLDRIPYITSAAYYMMNVIGDSGKSAGSIQLSMRDNYRLRLEVYKTSDTMETAYSSTDNTFVTNKWYHVVVLYSTSPNQVTYYINGKLDRTITLTNQTSCWIGPLYIGSYGNSTRFLDGTLDELRVYNRQLTEDEIEYLAAGEAATGSIMQKISTPANFIDETENQSIVNFPDFAEFIRNFQ